MSLTSVIRSTTLSLLRNFPSKRGARSRASIWKNSGGISFISAVVRVNGYSGLTRTARVLEQLFSRARSATGVVTLRSDSWSTRFDRRAGVFISEPPNQRIWLFQKCATLTFVLDIWRVMVMLSCSYGTEWRLICPNKTWTKKPNLKSEFESGPKNSIPIGFSSKKYSNGLKTRYFGYRIIPDSNRNPN